MVEMDEHFLHVSIVGGGAAGEQRRRFGYEGVEGRVNCNWLHLDVQKLSRFRANMDSGYGTSCTCYSSYFCNYDIPEIELV